MIDNGYLELHMPPTCVRARDPGRSRLRSPRTSGDAASVSRRPDPPAASRRHPRTQGRIGAGGKVPGAATFTSGFTGAGCCVRT
jgi:hypothetical protein